MKYRWTFAQPQPALAESLARQLNVSPLLAQCLLNRGLVEPEPISRFLTPRLANLADPLLLPNMAAAVERLFRARDAREPLVIFGDYDVDGVTSTALLVEFLRALGWQAEYYLPHRMEEGYGLSQAGVEKCLAKFPVSLVLAVDCGSASAVQVDWLKGRGVDVIVLDHHQVCSPPPAAVALVNPQLSRAAGEGSFTELCSVGLAFKLCHALLKHGRAAGIPQAQDYDLRPLLDLVALGTIADLVPLVGENRILVTAGLQRLSSTVRPGLVALKEVARVNGPVGAYEVGFQLGPRLNAAGRLETALDALHLLLSPTVAEARPLAARLDACNRDRQQIERDISHEVIASVRARFNADTDFVVVEGEPRWHIGVVGIVASRVLGEFYRPTIVVGGDGDLWRGSGRSVAGFDLAAALRECGDLLVRHGGHAMAAGITIEPDKMPAFRERLNTLARRTLRSDQLQKPLNIDSEVSTADLTLARLEELERLQQTGIGNPAVQFCLRGVSHARALQRVGQDKQHAKMWVTDGKRTCDAVLWGVGDGALPVGTFDLAFTPQINEYNNSRTVQLKVTDWRAPGADPTML
jgi:single-stranded-DNA-specific exonuclease